jgi:glyoxylase-like metal-dependent hydrolase (beta-lactamase superfamily II)/rhodanese-related sulfurtransferase
MDLDVFVTPGLGDNSFLVVSGDEAAVVDPQRDAWRFLAAAEARTARVLAVLETHVHNDYVSGAHEIRAATGAELVLPGAGRYEFPHRPAAEGEQVRIGDLRLVALATPGHTFEHLAWLVYEGDAESPVAVFTGGSLLVGSAGRTDLLGPDHADELTRAQYETIRRLSVLPDEVQVLPTHGAGSFCVAAMPATARTTTIGSERQQNLLLTATDQGEFTEELRSELLAYPAYYRYMAPINRAGVAVLRRLPQPPARTPDEVAATASAGGWVVDGRDRDAFAAGHLPGSVNIELNAGFASYVGWMLPFDAPITLVLPEPLDESLAEATTQLIRIGWTRLTGYLDGGVAAWVAGGRELRSYPTGSVQQLCEAYERGEQPPVLDVRQPLELAWGQVPGAEAIFIADIPARLADLAARRSHLPPATAIWVICSNGHRASIAASLLDRAGIPVCLVGTGGVGEWRQHCRGVLSGAGAGPRAAAGGNFGSE